MFLLLYSWRSTRLKNQAEIKVWCLFHSENEKKNHIATMLVAFYSNSTLVMHK